MQTKNIKAVLNRSEKSIKTSEGWENAVACKELIDLGRSHDTMLAALEWFSDFCYEHPDWTENQLCNGRDDSAEAGWLDSARAAINSAKGGAL